MVESRRVARSLIVLVCLMLSGQWLAPRPARAWPWTTRVNVYGYAYNNLHSRQYGASHVELYRYESWTGRYWLVARAQCNYQGRWYVNGVEVNREYFVVAYAPAGGLALKSAYCPYQYIPKPGGYPSDYKFPDIHVRW